MSTELEPELPTGAPSLATVEQGEGFRKSLGLPDVIAQSLSVIAPAMSGAFLTYLASTKAGGVCHDFGFASG